MKNTISIAFYKGKYGKFWDWLVMFFTGSKFSHCELRIINYSYSSSMRDGGVRAKIIDYDPKKWEIIDLQVSYNDKKRIWEFYRNTKNDGYDIIPVLAYPFWNFDIGDDLGKWFCSEWVAMALNKAGFNIEKLLTPDQLYKKLIERNKPLATKTT